MKKPDRVGKMVKQDAVNKNGESWHEKCDEK